MELLATDGPPVRTSFGAWVNKRVVLLVGMNDLRVPLRGIVVGESTGAVRFRLAETWDVDIYRSLILAIDEDKVIQLFE